MERQKIIIALLAILLLTTGLAFAKGDFSQADLDRLLNGDKNLAGAKLEKVNLKGMDLSGRNFSKADLEKANLHGANLSNCNFEGADLEEANLTGANLTNTNFKNADLEETHLKGASIKGAIFKGAELEFATWIDGRTCAEDSLGACW